MADLWGGGGVGGKGVDITSVSLAGFVAGSRACVPCFACCAHDSSSQHQLARHACMHMQRPLDMRRSPRNLWWLAVAAAGPSSSAGLSSIMGLAGGAACMGPLLSQSPAANVTCSCFAQAVQLPAQQRDALGQDVASAEVPAGCSTVAHGMQL